MNKSIKAILSYLGICLFVFFCCSPVAYAVDGSKQTDYDGHLCKISGSTKQVCANCHIPHGAKGMRIWAQSGKDNDILKKQSANTTPVVKDLCASCHYSGNQSFPGIQSGLHWKKDGGQWCGSGDPDKNNKNGNVFLGGSANHVMGPQLSPKADGTFASTKAEVIGFPFSKDEGFYCGSCHNPHKQPNKDMSGHGDYLRLNSKTTSAGITHDRKQFCRQCHPQHSTAKDGQGNSLANIHPNDEPVCESCHRPHDGFPSDDPVTAASIFIDPLPDLGVFGFQAKATLKRNSGSANASGGVSYESAKCTSCHLSTGIWLDAPKLRADRAHHPISNYWANTSCYTCHDKPDISGKTIRLDGFDAKGNPADPKDQIFGCISCHGAHSTGIEGNPSFLLYASFKDDDTAFCEYCHNSTNENDHPKNQSLLMANGGKHYKLGGNKTDPTNHVTRTFKATNLRTEKVVRCGGCMFCHFIHQNQDDPRVIPTVASSRADIRALMRTPAVALNWGTQGAPGQGAVALKSDPLDRYEAMCYGCHSNKDIVGNFEKDGSLLNPSRHSHRFACAITGKNTNENIGRAGTFPLADGTPGAGPGKDGAMDDYGTVKGQIYCGSCHDAHINTKPPYLFRLSPDDHASPFKSDEVGKSFNSQAERDGFCEQCHCTVNGSDPMAVGATHPVGNDKVPVVPHTSAEFPKQFAGGGSGSPLGITAMSNTTRDGVLCLTCHNVHAAATAWDGATTSEPRTSAAVASNGQKTGVHGQLLVMDNYSKEPGSNMCAACHVNYGDEDQSQAH